MRNVCKACSVSRLASTHNRLVLPGAAAIHGNGNESANVIVDNSIANVLQGKAGNDSLSGGAGTETCVCDTTANIGGNRNTITDFSHGSDNIALSKTIFSGFGSVSPTQQLVHPGGTPSQLNFTRLLFNSGTLVVSRDADGCGQTKPPIDVAALTGLTTRSVSDFALVTFARIQRATPTGQPLRVTPGSPEGSRHWQAPPQGPGAEPPHQTQRGLKGRPPPRRRGALALAKANC